MRSLVITGANRGVGLELVKQFLSHPKGKPEIIIATARKPDEAKELQELAGNDTSLHILHLDITKFDSFKDFCDKVSKIVGDDGLNVLINNAGILIEPRDGTLETVTADHLTAHFTTNTVGPIMLTQALMPLLKKAAEKKAKGISQDRAAVMFMSCSQGSVDGNKGPNGGGYWGYRESKAAMNIAVRTICKEMTPQGVGVLILHPGMVKTDLGGPNATVNPTQSAAGLAKVILAFNDKSNGAFLQFDGKKVPW